MSPPNKWQPDTSQGTSYVDDDDEDDLFQDAIDAIPNVGEISAAAAGVSFNDLVNTGVVIDTDHTPSREERELAEDRNETYGGEDEEPGEGSESKWWTVDQLKKHLEESKSVRPTTGLPDDAEGTPFEIRKSQMEVIYRHPDTNEPLVWKDKQHCGWGKKVEPDCSVEYDIEAYAEHNDEPFDSSKIVDRVYRSKLNADPVLPGLFICLTSMYAGEKSQFIIHYSVGFGELGCPPRIPPKTDIFYDIEMKKVIEEGTIADFFLMTSEEQQLVPFDKIIEMADRERKSGNAYFADERMKPAGIRYKRAIKVLEERMFKDAEEEKRAKVILLKLYCNVANSSIHLCRPYASMHYCRKALDIDKENAKAMYFYGKAKIMSGDYGEAEVWLLKARKLNPNSSEISEQLAILNRRIQDSLFSVRDMEQRMAQMFVSDSQKKAGGDANGKKSEKSAAGKV